jgi:outer membrane protein assembly factor BamB
MTNARTAVFTLVMLAAAASGVEAQNGVSEQHGMFRGGPARTGVYDRAVSGRALLGVQWRFMTDGDVIGSPAVAGDIAFIGSGDGVMYALDRATGALRWKRDVGSPIASSPAVGRGRVFFGTRDGRFHALDAATGEVRWRLSTGADHAWPWGHESGDVYTSSPVHVDGMVIFGAGDGGIYAIDASTGRRRWRASTGGRVRSSPAVADGRVYVGSADGRVYAFDLATGTLKWRYDTEGVKLDSRNFGYDRRTVQSSPAVSGGTVFVGARDGFLYAIDAATGQLRWRFDHKISWVNTSPAVQDTVVYAGSSDGQFVQAVHTGTGREIWRAKAGVTWSSPAVAGDVVYAGDGAGRVNAFDRRTGDPLWSFRTGSQVYGSPVPLGNLVFFGSTDGGVYALRVGSGPPIHRAVFFDSTLLKASWIGDPGLLSRYFVNRGYTLVDARTLGEFLEARIVDKAPSVVVFAIDHLPPAVVDTSALERSPFRHYLDVGGKAVWPGVPPLLFVKDPQTGNVGGLAALKWAAPSRLLGVDHEAAMFDVRGVRATAAGKKWGLPNRWRASWGVAIDSTITVLGRDELGLTTSWVRRYGGPEGTGFVRVPADDPLVVYLAAEYRPGPPQ